MSFLSKSTLAAAVLAAGFDWDEVYGFFDLENPHKNNNEADAFSSCRWKGHSFSAHIFSSGTRLYSIGLH